MKHEYQMHWYENHEVATYQVFMALATILTKFTNILCSDFNSIGIFVKTKDFDKSYFDDFIYYILSHIKLYGKCEIFLI